jgi:hypothetical protein
MFDARSTATEFLDLPDCDPKLAEASYRFMEIVNYRFGGIRTVRHFLDVETRGRNIGTPLRILDIGSGGCDIPLAISRWANERNIPVRFTCLETGSHAIGIAGSNIMRSNNPELQLLQEDVFSHCPSEPYDYAVASMCFHHFSDTQILALLRRLRGFVLKGALINDLWRSRPALLAARLLLAGVRASAGVRHDALLSIRRGFKPDELSALLRQLENVAVSVETSRWFRIAAVIKFDKGAGE